MKNYSIRRKIAVYSVFLLGFLFAGTQVSAATVNVSTIAALQSAINSAASGDIIVLADGTYSGATINFASGRNGITVKSATPGGVFLTGTVNVTISGNGNTFSGFQITSGSNSGWPIEVQGSSNLVTQINIDGYSSQKYINLKNPGQYNVISYCNFRNKPTTAPIGNLIHIDPNATLPGYHKIRYCSFLDMPGAGGDNGNECIRISNGATSTYVSRTVVEFNYFNNTGMGDSEVVSIKCRENVLRYNTMTNNMAANFCCRNGDSNIVYGNFFLNSGGIRVKEANNIYCYNNYMENCGDGTVTAPIKYVYVSPNLKNINFFHNTIVGGSPIELDTGATGNTWANNIFKKTSGNIFMGSPSGISWAGNIYQGTLGVTISSGMTSVDPQLVRNSEGYYGLSSSSPAIDAASASYPAIVDIANIDDDPTLTMDISGQARGASAILKDVGCDEYGVNSTLNHPLSRSDVGPSYLGGPGGANVAPSVTLTAPANGASYTAPASIAMTANATDSDGTITTVGFYNGTTLLGSDTSSPYAYTWTNVAVGSYNLTARATDNSGAVSTSAVAAVTVNVANAAPVFTVDPMSKAGATEDAAYTGQTLSGSATDADGDTLTYSAQSGPAWLSIATDGTLSGTPANSDVGNNSWQVQVSDGKGGTDVATLNITVANVNDAPVFTVDPMSKTAATEDIAYTGQTLSGSATDVDAGAVLTYSKVSGPAWLSIATSGALSGTPVNADNGPNSWTVQVSDGLGGTDTAVLNITVTAVNDAPVFTADPINQTAATEDVAYSATIAGSATDEEGAALTYSKVSGPAWLSVAANGALSGTPLNADVGANSGTVQVSDGSLTDTATLNITVINVNDAPVFTVDPMSRANVTAGTAYTGQTLAGSATDVDAGASLTYSKVSGPAWLVVATSGALTGTPASTNVGANSWTVQVSDGTATDTAVLNITVDAASVQILTNTFVSVGADDGYVLESTETSNVGGSMAATSSGTAALRIGDDASKKQYKTVVSFDTSALPDGATIVSATLKLLRGTVSSTPTSLGAINVDIIGGTGFGGATALANGDFEAAAGATGVATMSYPSANGTWSTGALNAAGLAQLNKTGTTQLKVYFATDDDNDTTADYLGFYSGENSTTGNRPVLVIVYQ